MLLSDGILRRPWCRTGYGRTGRRDQDIVELSSSCAVTVSERRRLRGRYGLGFNDAIRTALFRWLLSRTLFPESVSGGEGERRRGPDDTEWCMTPLGAGPFNPC